MDFSAGAIIYWALGWVLMYGSSKAGLFGLDQFFLSGADSGLFRYWIWAGSGWLANSVGGWAALAVGLFANTPEMKGGGFSQLGIQALGDVSVFAWAFEAARL